MFKGVPLKFVSYYCLISTYLDLAMISKQFYSSLLPVLLEECFFLMTCCQCAQKTTGVINNSDNTVSVYFTLPAPRL